MSRDILLDTCALIWLAEEERISDAATQALLENNQNGAGIFVSPITAWEVGMLMSHGRLTSSLTPNAWFRRALQHSRVTFAEMTPNLLIASSFLPGDPPRNPADRIIATTAREYGHTVMTRDRELLDYADQGHLSALPC